MSDKHVMVLRYNPKKKYFLISLKLKEQVGALADVSRVLAIRGFDILEGHIFVNPEELHGYMTFFAEASNPKVDSRFIKQLLEGSSFLESATVIESRRGLIIDSVNFPLRSSLGDRAILLRSEPFRQMLSWVMERYGKEGEEMVYQSGYAYGSVSWTELFGGLEMDKQALEEYLQVLSAIGIGRPRIERFEAEVPSIHIVVESSFECEGVTSSTPRAIFLSGFLAGALGALFGKELFCAETKCVANGAKVCEFEIGPKA